MYLTYAQYQELGGKMPQADFAVYEPRAEMLMDHWTLNRLKSDRVQADLAQLGYDNAVLVTMAALVDRMPGIAANREAIAAGEVVTSFSNGQNTFGYDSKADRDGSAEAEAYGAIMELLPIELVSAAVEWNDAR